MVKHPAAQGLEVEFTIPYVIADMILDVITSSVDGNLLSHWSLKKMIDFVQAAY